MKKPKRKAHTGNPASKRGAKDGGDGARRCGWLRWLGREGNTFFALPEWLSGLILLAVAGVALAVWRWLSA
jgi:hypothetical protein